MPLNYLNSGPEDVYALNRLGSTFSDMVIGLQQNRMRQQQFLAAQALQQARLQLEREAEQHNELTARETRKKIGAETAEIGARGRLYGAQAQTEGDTSRAGQMLGRDVQQLSDYPEGMAMNQALRGDIGRQGAILAATHPGNIGVQIPQLMSLNDPIIRNLIATGGPSVGNVPAGGTAFDYTTKQPIFQSPPRVALRDPDAILNERLRTLGSNLGSMGRGFLDRTPEFVGTRAAYNEALGKVTGAPPVPVPVQDQSPPIPKKGEVYKGYIFKGGDPADKNNWEKAQAQ